MFLFSILILLGGCDAENQPSETQQTPKKSTLIPVPIDLQKNIDEVGSSNGMEIIPLGEKLPPPLKAVANEWRKNRVIFYNLMQKLEQFRFNESIEISAYAEMRKSGRQSADSACIRAVNRRYFLQEISARGVSVENGLLEKDKNLGQFYDEAQIRGMDLEAVQKRIRELDDHLSATLKADFSRIDQIVKNLENEDYPVSGKDIAIGPPDVYMGYSAGALVIAK
jgi:hypothetical protein